MIAKAAAAIIDAQKTHQVVLVYLNINAETTVRRRANPEFLKSTLPFSDEIAEATRLENFLGSGAKKLVETEESLPGLFLPILDIDNNKDGKEFIETTSSAILKFLKEKN